MAFVLKYFTIFIFLAVGIIIISETALSEDFDKIQYFAIERPHVTYVNPKYISYVSVISKRYNRHDPVHYLCAKVTSLVGAGNNVTWNYYILQFLTNQYKPSFVEVHIKTCQFINHPIVGEPFRILMKGNYSCPFPAGYYDLRNMSLTLQGIKNFPFPKGRVVLNVTITSTGELVGSGYADFQIEEMKVKKKGLIGYL